MKIIIFLLIILIPSSAFCLTAAEKLLPMMQGAVSVSSNFLRTSDQKWLVTSDGKVLKTPGTDSTDKLLRTSDNKLLKTSDDKILKTP